MPPVTLLLVSKGIELLRLFYGCSTVVLICFTCPAITVVTVMFYFGYRDSWTVGRAKTTPDPKCNTLQTNKPKKPCMRMTGFLIELYISPNCKAHHICLILHQFRRTATDPHTRVRAHCLYRHTTRAAVLRPRVLGTLNSRVVSRVSSADRLGKPEEKAEIMEHAGIDADR